MSEVVCLENVLLDPFDGDIFHGTDELGENVYFRILALFEYRGRGYDVYAYTLDPNSCYIGEVFEYDEGETSDVHKYMSVPLSAGPLFEEVKTAWNAYTDTLEYDEDGNVIVTDDDEDEHV